MSYAAALNRRSIIHSRAREHSLSTQGRKAVIFLLILLIVLFGVLYIVQANSVATGGYKIQEHKSRVKELQAENKNFELKLSEVRSLGFLEERIESLNMVKAEKVDYLSPVSEVAAR